MAESFKANCEDCIQYQFFELLGILLQLFKSWPNRIMTFFQPNGQSFTKVRQYESLQPSIEGGMGQQLKIKPIIGETRAEQKCDFVLQYFIRKYHEDYPRPEISFQKNFLDQHIKSLDTILQKTKESIPTLRALSKNQSIQTHLQNTTPLLSKNNQPLWLQNLPLTIQLAQHDQFIKDLRRQHDLTQFLNYVSEHYQKQIATPLIIITADLWAEVSSLHFKQKQIRDLQRTATSWTKLNYLTYYQRPDFQPLTTNPQPHPHPSSQPTSSKLFQELLLRYTTTVLLIVAGFFQNPYLEQPDHCDRLRDVDYPKRQFSHVSISFFSSYQIFSDSEEEQGPTKKPKLD